MKETHRPNLHLHRQGRRLQFLGLLLLSADAGFGFLLFRGDFGYRHLSSVLFPLLLAAILAFAALMAWGGSLIRRSQVPTETGA